MFSNFLENNCVSHNSCVGNRKKNSGELCRRQRFSSILWGGKLQQKTMFSIDIHPSDPHATPLCSAQKGPAGSCKNQQGVIIWYIRFIFNIYNSRSVNRVKQKISIICFQFHIIYLFKKAPYASIRFLAL
jgi:hypothetical protein